MTWHALLPGAAVGVAAGAVASVAGFGIGSLLTPLFMLHTDTRLAVAAVSIPHLAATVYRYVGLRRYVNRRVLWSFGLMSAAGGLAGALLHRFAASPALTALFAGLLILAGVTGLTGWSDRIRLTGPAGWVAGALSGIFGGLVGNQGGIRSAAMLGFDVSKHEFVATATAVALMVDVARVPVYLATQGREIMPLWPLVAAATAGTLAGTWLGGPLLRRVPDRIFRRVVSVVILILGVAMLWSAVR